MSSNAAFDQKINEAIAIFFQETGRTAPFSAADKKRIQDIYKGRKEGSIDNVGKATSLAAKKDDRTGAGFIKTFGTAVGSASTAAGIVHQLNRSALDRQKQTFDEKLATQKRTLEEQAARTKAGIEEQKLAIETRLTALKEETAARRIAIDNQTAVMQRTEAKLNNALKISEESRKAEGFIASQQTMTLQNTIASFKATLEQQAVTIRASEIELKRLVANEVRLLERDKFVQAKLKDAREAAAAANKIVADQTHRNIETGLKVDAFNNQAPQTLAKSHQAVRNLQITENTRDLVAAIENQSKIPPSASVGFDSVASSDHYIPTGFRVDVPRLGEKLITETPTTFGLSREQINTFAASPDTTLSNGINEQLKQLRTISGKAWSASNRVIDLPSSGTAHLIETFENTPRHIQGWVQFLDGYAGDPANLNLGTLQLLQGFGMQMTRAVHALDSVGALFTPSNAANSLGQWVAYAGAAANDLAIFNAARTFDQVLRLAL